jgi:outer membrane protein assembly factor BamA
MRHATFFLTATLAFCAFAHSATAQLFLPRTIQFKGAPEYTDAELLAASGLKKGILIDSTKLGVYGHRLLDSGVFSTLTYKCNGQDLIYLVTPATDLLPIRIDNLPITASEDLNTKLHEQLPLFHGKVPAAGGLADDVRKALEQMLAAQGITASIEAAATASQAPGKNGVVSYTITSPSVLVGEIKLKSTSTPLEPGAEAILAHLTGSPYDVAGTPSQISTYLGNYYRDKGYTEAAVEVASHGAVTASADSILVPFEITVTPGIQYRLAKVELAPDMIVSQADFDHQSRIHSGDIADGQHVTENWEYISRQYHNLGYVKASVHPVASFDRVKNTVSYSVTADPGPVYTMGQLTIENVNDELRAAMLAAWTMPAGTVFDESAIMTFYASGGGNPVLRRVYPTVDTRYVLHLHDENRTVDVILRLEKKH